ncbi:GFA family protein [Allohahella marinimesophila]|uniref:GFA family protein n=1 Tax=Allohahella marinimesophila TaxID=1054972 RepID=A0ABP7PMG2_9GAMM
MPIQPVQPTAKPLTGGCLCGGIRYEVDVINGRIGHCHCTMCRRFHGAAYATFGEASANSFRWTAGESLLQAFKAENGTVRQFCRQCGSSLTFTSASNPAGIVEFAAATLDNESLGSRCDELVPDAHIFVADKAPWVNIDDGLPQYRAGRPSERLR